MKSVIVLATVFFPVASVAGWTTRDGRTFEAELRAADGLRATFSRPDKPPVVVPLANLTPVDVAAIRAWRADRRKPLVVPSQLGPWPAHAVAPAGDVRLLGGEAGAFTYQSANFRITSDLKLPLGAVNDIAKVLEATRAALIAIPLGLHAGGEREPYHVAMFRDNDGYAKAGGIGGSGGHYDSRRRRMIVLLPNLGIEEKDGTLRLDHARNLFILKHEVTHQLMDRWHGHMPMWINEGIAEVIASLPYSRGHYTLKPPGAGMRDYLLKWSGSKTDRSIRLVPPAKLMAMDREDWDSALGQREAYDSYNSAALLTCHFIQQDGGKALAGYLDALRRGENEETAERDHLLRGKTRESLNAEVAALAKKLGVELVDF